MPRVILTDTNPPIPGADAIRWRAYFDDEAGEEGARHGSGRTRLQAAYALCLECATPAEAMAVAIAILEVAREGLSEPKPEGLPSPYLIGHARGLDSGMGLAIGALRGIA